MSVEMYLTAHIVPMALFEDKPAFKAHCDWLVELWQDEIEANEYDSIGNTEVKIHRMMKIKIEGEWVLVNPMRDEEGNQLPEVVQVTVEGQVVP